MIVRPAEAGDAAAVRFVLEAAFPTADEADLVEALGRDGDLAIALVAEVEGQIAGSIAFSRMDVMADGATLSALGLAPVAVGPSHQRQGVAAALIRAGLDAARAKGVEIVFVLGDPAYYERFGFAAATAAPFASPYADEHFMASMLAARHLPTEGRADYAPAFAAL